MSFHHQQSMEHLIERLRSAEGGNLLPGGSLSRRSSLCDSSEESSRPSSRSQTRTPHQHQGLDNPEDSAAGSMVIDPEEEDEEEQEVVIVNTNMCTSCQAENQLRQALSVQQARQRSFLHGSVGPFQTLLGLSELKRTLPSGQLKVFVGTWNMNGKDPPARLEDLLLPTPLQVMPDVVAIGTQETNGDRTEWEVSIQETLGAGHVLFDSVELGTLHLAVFLRRDLIWVASIPESESHSVRAGSAFRTKGGVAVGFSLFGTSFLFLNCHLTAHAEKAAERERDLKRIFNSLDLPKELPVRRKHRDVTANYDVVFLCGDLNFRIDKPREEVIDIVAHHWRTEQQQLLHRAENPDDGVAGSSRASSMLLGSDQLKRSLQQNRVLKNFREADIEFAPTYKYIPGSDEFDDSAKQRVPSYTDRILWKERKSGTVHWDHYDSVCELKSSDHFPVWASFTVPVKPGRETIPLSAGLFNRAVYVEGIKRRVQAWDPRKASGSTTSTCTIQ